MRQKEEAEKQQNKTIVSRKISEQVEEKSQLLQQRNKKSVEAKETLKKGEDEETIQIANSLSLSLKEILFKKRPIVAVQEKSEEQKKQEEMFELVYQRYPYLQTNMKKQKRLLGQAQGNHSEELKEYHQNRDDLHSHEELVTKHRKELKRWEDLYIEFLFTMMKQGCDYRNTGLSRYLKQLQDLGEGVKTQHLPDILDQNCKQYLFQKRILEQKIQDLQIIQSFTLERYKTQMKSNFLQISSTNSADPISCLTIDPHQNEPFGAMLRKLLYKDLVDINTKETIDNLMYQKIRKDIPNQFPKEFSTTQRLYGPKTSALDDQNHDQFQQIFQGDILLFEGEQLINSYSDKPSFFSFYEKKNRQIIKLSNQLKEISTQELKRIIKEFDFRNYEQNHKATCSHVLCVLWGVEIAINELVRNQMLKNKALPISK